MKSTNTITGLSLIALAFALAGCTKASSPDDATSAASVTATSAPGTSRVDISALNPVVTDTPCPKQFPNGKCGTVKVPLNYADPKGAQIDVGFIQYKAKNAKADQGRLFHLINGGPSASWLTESEEKLMAFEPLLQDSAVLMIEPRGVGMSGPLDCRSVDPDNIMTGAPVIKGSIEVVEACAKMVGPKMVHYTTANTAHDFALITRALKYDKVDLLGFSYGSILAPTYAALHPEHIRTMTLDGALPLKPKSLTGDENRYAASMRIYDDMCKQTKACTLDEFKVAITNVLSQLRKAPRLLAGVEPAAKLPADAQLDPRLLAGIFDLLPGFGEVNGKPTAYHPMLGGVLAAAKGDWSALDAAAVEFYKAALTPVPNTEPSAQGLNFSIVCNDFRMPWDRNDSAKVKDEKLSAVEAAFKPDAFAPFTAQEWGRRSLGYNFNATCLFWPGTSPNPSEDPALANFTWPASLPVMVLNGDLDKQTVTEEARASAAQFKNVRFIRVKSAPHVIMLASQCARESLVEFIQTKTVAKPDACINENPITWVMGAAPKSN